MERATLNSLEAVIAISKRGTFRAAAIDLGMSTTALSHAIGKLESNLGVRLFNRTTRSVSLTEAGRLFVERVGPTLQDIHGALDAVKFYRETPSGTIRINAAPSAAREITPLVFEFVRRYPDMNVDLVTEARLIDIVAAGFDLGVRAESLVPSDMIAVRLERAQRYAIVGSQEYFKGKTRPHVPTDLHTNAFAFGCRTGRSSAGLSRRMKKPSRSTYLAVSFSMKHPSHEPPHWKGSESAASWSRISLPMWREGGLSGYCRIGRHLIQGFASTILAVATCRRELKPFYP